MGLLWAKDRPVAETSKCATHDIHKEQTSVRPARSNPQSHQASGRTPATLDCAVTGTVTIVRNTDTLCGQNGLFTFMPRLPADLCVCTGQAWTVGFSLQLVRSVRDGNTADRSTWVCNTVVVKIR